MKIPRVLLVALCMFFSMNLYSDCEAPGEFEQPIVTAMGAEVFSLDLISTLPVPQPAPKSARELLDIADGYQQIGMDTMSIRSISHRATLPTPLPGAKKAVWPLPPPWALIKQATRLQDHALWTVQRLDDQIDKAFDHGTISQDDYSDFMDIQADLTDQISTLPLPIPNPDIEPE